MQLNELATTADPLVADHATAILGEGHLSFRLPSIGLHDRLDRAHTRECCVEGARLDSPASRLGPELGEPSRGTRLRALAGARHREEAPDARKASAVRRSDNRIGRACSQAAAEQLHD